MKVPKRIGRIGLGLSLLGFAGLLSAASSHAAEPDLWYLQRGNNNLVFVQVDPSGSSATFTTATFSPPVNSGVALTELSDGSLVGADDLTGTCDSNGNTDIFHVPSPPTTGGVATRVVVGTMVGIQLEALYTDCNGFIYAMDTGSNCSTGSGNRLLRFTGDVVGGDLSYEVLPGFSGPDVDDLGPGINGGVITDTPGLMIDTGTLYSVDYTTGSFSSIGSTAGTFGTHALGAGFTDGLPHAYVLSVTGTLSEINPATGATLVTVATGPGGPTGTPEHAMAMTGGLPPNCDGGIEPPPTPVQKSTWGLIKGRYQTDSDQ